jgi:hypothetical protein
MSFDKSRWRQRDFSQIQWAMLDLSCGAGNT